MNIGLFYTPVSIYQMTRGALVLWVGLFSVMFLRRHLWLYQCVPFLPYPHPNNPWSSTYEQYTMCRWLSLVTVMIGVSIVGLSGSLAKATEEPHAGQGLRLLSAMVEPIEDLPAPTTVFVGEHHSVQLQDDCAHNIV